MYDNLLLLPLFQGLSKDNFTTIIEKVKFHFQTFQEGDIIMRQGDTCHELCYLLDGSIIAETVDKKYEFSLSEVISEPRILEPYSLFGMQPNYKSTYRAKNKAHILTIDKAFIFSELNKYEIFRLNFFNILSNSTQAAHQKLWNTHIGNLREKFMNFLLLRCLEAKGEKTLQITMEDLSQLINETRINVSRLLNEWQERKLIQLKRKEIFIPALERLIEDTL